MQTRTILDHTRLHSLKRFSLDDTAEVKMSPTGNFYDHYVKKSMIFRIPT